ncbi:isoleucine--tRNA ligase [soil metagenome]
MTSTQIDVAFEIVEAPNAPELVGAYAVIWTTTPWTIPVNQGIAYGEDLQYSLCRLRVEVETLPGFESHVVTTDVSDALAETGVPLDFRPVVIATELRDSFENRVQLALDRIDLAALGASKAAIEVEWQFSQSENAGAPGWSFPGSRFADATARHPMHHLGGFFAKPRPFLPAPHVTTDAGTGLVHMAPDHGEEDFLACKPYGIDPVFAVQDDGRYRADWAWLGGNPLSVINTKLNAPEGPVCTDLRAAGALLSASPFQHSYPHSWRSKARIIYRCTPQWFIPMDRPTHGGIDAVIALDPALVGTGPIALPTNAPTLREIAVDAIEATRWVPERSTNRIRSMVEGRPDWVISRQRAWGVPIALYVHRQSGEYLNDAGVNARIVEAFKAGGADAWFGADHQALLGPDYALADYEVVNDILDVWFDSGSTHSFVVEARYGKDARADLYLEGSDQHRGWFQASLLESCGTRGHAPYGAVLTHGFALDGQGRKMSKSLGNVVDPLKIIGESGADILRMWVASTDYFDDVRIGKEVLAGSSDAYRKLRNSFRYLLGALADFSEEEKVPVAEMPELERYMLHRLAELDAELRTVVEDKADESWLEFGRYTRALNDFANIDLSAFFFDIRKDCLYCDVNVATGVQTEKRRAYRTVLDTIFHALVRYAAPIIPFTTEEVWGSRYPEGGSVHLLEWPEVDAGWHDAALGERWAGIREARIEVNEAIEPLRREKAVRSSLEAEVTRYYVPRDVDFAEICIVADVREGGDGITAVPTEHHKCGRCWRHLPEVTQDGTLCGRCEEVLA